jgi:hypothetical protein
MPNKRRRAGFDPESFLSPGRTPATSTLAVVVGFSSPFQPAKEDFGGVERFASFWSASFGIENHPQGLTVAPDTVAEMDCPRTRQAGYLHTFPVLVPAKEHRDFTESTILRAKL